MAEHTLAQLRSVLREVREAIVAGAADTLWMPSGIETVVDFIDAALLTDGRRVCKRGHSLHPEGPNFRTVKGSGDYKHKTYIVCRQCNIDRARARYQRMKHGTNIGAAQGNQ